MHYLSDKYLDRHKDFLKKGLVGLDELRGEELYHIHKKQRYNRQVLKTMLIRGLDVKLVCFKDKRAFTAPCLFLDFINTAGRNNIHYLHTYKQKIYIRNPNNLYKIRHWILDNLYDFESYGAEAFNKEFIRKLMEFEIY